MGEVFGGAVRQQVLPAAVGWSRALLHRLQRPGGEKDKQGGTPVPSQLGVDEHPSSSP